MHTTLTDGPADGKGRRLLPQHLDDLRKSGLRDEIIAASRVYSESDPERVRAFLGSYLRARKTAPALWERALRLSRSSTRTGNWWTLAAFRGWVSRGAATVRPLQTRQAA